MLGMDYVTTMSLRDPSGCDLECGGFALHCTENTSVPDAGERALFFLPAAAGTAAGTGAGSCARCCKDTRGSEEWVSRKEHITP